MSGDLISRSKFLESIEGMDWYTIHVNGEVSQGAPSEEVAWYKATDIYAAIENAPAAGVGGSVVGCDYENGELVSMMTEDGARYDRVVHAHWRGYWCSRCDELSEENYSRCPHCGAHMDEEVADET